LRKMRILFPTLVLFVHILFFGCGGASGQGSTTASSPIMSGSGVSDFSLKDINGQSVALSDYMGDKVVVINFWAPCCEASRQITIDSQALYEKMKDDVVFFGIAVDEPEFRSQVASLVKQRGIKYPVLYDTESDVINQLNPKRALPYTVIIDKSGEVVWMHDGYVPGDDKLIEDAVRKALGTT
jgi:peroxiredoxin